MRVYHRVSIGGLDSRLAHSRLPSALSALALLVKEFGVRNRFRAYLTLPFRLLQF